ncbi:hypothetical protein A2533_05195 [Candidatus Falkowbacteria bacterium RIFOXYD2_FULL_35_9]|uniref:Uncharacterized protein n=1 Tax=Candidatus Falkowbacteria bacterium RIFOXYC2_FULL_36_12 TaxID=1798002 RepID=A0A1F5T091_9BACT|nr:MAG: hypothetical protein A2300_03620 [Candidatus Falkowbacteria bacterium RIFOXYB2_FULL_35_7]OGF32370.1 MAG: hypothetical protein A2478_03560 [Candidatus Falkowbacteria bacterium RIFOXYC2_FULL_36_12]OGF46484.1 MAG: hypothetical protein A2533_05195 [Candidatus Falkowbacteria bacterium RIFOXYD2_FULL_35_9]
MSMEHFRRTKESFTNDDDIFDSTTFEQIARELKESDFYILQNVDSVKLSAEQRRLYEQVKQFCLETSAEFKQEFVLLLDRYKDKNKVLSDKIIEFLVKNKIDVPKFELLNGVAALKALKTSKLETHDIAPNDLIVIFNLPTPLAVYWWKGGVEEWGDSSVKIDGQIIEWGLFYRRLMNVIWGMQGYYENEKNLKFERLNEPCQHDPKNYYYVWRITSYQPFDFKN